MVLCLLRVCEIKTQYTMETRCLTGTGKSHSNEGMNYKTQEQNMFVGHFLTSEPLYQLHRILNYIKIRCVKSRGIYLQNMSEIDHKMHMIYVLCLVYDYIYW